MTATTGAGDERLKAPAPAEAPAGEGLLAKRAQRNARVRGVVFLGLGILAAYFGIRSFGTSAKFSFWLDDTQNDAFVLETSVGTLWLIAGVASAFVGALQLVRGAGLRWRPWLLLLIAPYVAVTLAVLLDGIPANMTGVLSGTLESAAPLTLGAIAGILSERSGMLNIALEGKMLVGACVAAIVGSAVWMATGQPLAGVFVG